MGNIVGFTCQTKEEYKDTNLGSGNTKRILHCFMTFYMLSKYLVMQKDNQTDYKSDL